MITTNCLLPVGNDGSSLEAVNRIYEIKGCKHTSPLAICVGNVSDIDRFAVTDHLPHGLLDSLLPGPVTDVLRRGESSALERSLDPRFDNFEKLWEHCASVYDGGTLPSVRAGSTVVDLTTPYKYKILRPGSAKEETVAILEKHSFVETTLS
ncbi:hypothetical protein P8452_37626 [Trifolium repens]|nr:hypothetical protein P8452_37626 [Trifolium repens]